MPFGGSLRASRVLFIILLVFSEQVEAETIPACPTDSVIVPPSFCYVMLDQLHPTQAVIGYTAAYFKQIEFATIADATKRSTYANLEEYLLHDASFTAVQSPEGDFYLADGHHNAKALWDLNLKCTACEPRRPLPAAQPIYLTVTASYFGHPLNKTAFWEQLINTHNAYPYLINKQGLLEKVSAAEFAKKVPLNFDPHARNALADYPLRSATGLAKDLGWFKTPKDRANKSINFYQFHWATCLIALGYKPKFEDNGQLSMDSVYKAIDLLDSKHDVEENCAAMITKFGSRIIPNRKSTQSIAENTVNGELL